MTTEQFTELPEENQTPPAPEEEETEPRPSLKEELRWGVVFLMWFMFVVTAVFSGYTAWNDAPAGNEQLSPLTAELFGTSTAANASNLVAPFEVLSVLLLAALIAAIVLALKEGSN